MGSRSGPVRDPWALAVIATPDCMEVVIIRFATYMVAENVQVFCLSCSAVSSSPMPQRRRVPIDIGGWRGCGSGAGAGRDVVGDLKGRCLTFAEREEIAVGRAAGQSLRVIAARLGRSRRTIFRELSRNADPRRGYRASPAHAMAYHWASRPKPAKLALNLALRGKVKQDLAEKNSPKQITGRPRMELPNDPEMFVSPETICQSIYGQARGARAAIWPYVCAPGGRCGARAARSANARTGEVRTAFATV